uniref:Uncharacterized protein n=1 Tax=Varanus komodoensis TaxID=61221 RepID=A0A8D2L4S3_VARKO
RSPRTPTSHHILLCPCLRAWGLPCINWYCPLSKCTLKNLFGLNGFVRHRLYKNGAGGNPVYQRIFLCRGRVGFLTCVLEVVFFMLVLRTMLLACSLPVK